MFVPPSGLSGAITFAISGNSVGSTAPTSPPTISRFEASPEAETPSYTAPSPCRIRVTISSELSAYVTLMSHPLSSSNGVTQSMLSNPSVVPSSVYPCQAMSSSAPSPSPIAS